MNPVNQTLAQPAEKEQAMPKSNASAIPNKVKDRIGQRFGRLLVIG